MQIKKCKQNEMDKKEINKGIPVYLNVYNISGVNYFFQIFGLGIFHTGVEITDREYSFGSTDRDYSGVIAIRPGSLGFQVKEKIYLGNTLYNMDEIRYLSTLISFIWRGLTYDPFSKNCNSFTKFFGSVYLNQVLTTLIILIDLHFLRQYSAASTTLLNQLLEILFR